MTMDRIERDEFLHRLCAYMQETYPEQEWECLHSVLYSDKIGLRMFLAKDTQNGGRLKFMPMAHDPPFWFDPAKLSDFTFAETKELRLIGRDIQNKAVKVLCRLREEWETMRPEFEAKDREALALVERVARENSGNLIKTDREYHHVDAIIGGRHMSLRIVRMTGRVVFPEMVLGKDRALALIEAISV